MGQNPARAFCRFQMKGIDILIAYGLALPDL